MNKVFNINLGGYPFTIDADAYEHLNSYLKTIHNHFEKSDGYDEITSDIETRMAELFLENMSGRPIVTIKDVKEAINVMGTPEDFGAEPMDSNPLHDTFSIKTGKRLFRDGQDEVIGGVCSGIASYFGIQDPLWVRLAFLLFIISGGLSVLVYFVLWAILPKAETAADRLAMKGEPINVSNIARTIEDEIDLFSEKISDWGDDFGSKKSHDESKRPSALKKGVSLIGKLLAGIVQIIIKIGKPLLMVVAILFLIALLVSWIGMIIGFIFSFPFSEYLLPARPFLSIFGAANMLFLVGIPMFMIATLLLRMAFQTRLNKNIATGLWILWGINIFSFVTIGGMVAKEFNTGAKVTTSYDIPNENKDTITVKIGEATFPESIVHIGDLQVSEDHIVNPHIHLDIRQSEDGQFRIDQWNRSRGINNDDANALAQSIDYTISVENNVITLPKSFLIKKGSKWRAQDVKLTMYVPKGQSIKMGNSLWPVLDHFEQNREYGHTWVRSGQIWTMTDDGFNLANPKKEEERGILSYENFSKLDLEGNMKVYIQQGERFKVRFTGVDKYTKPYDIVQNEESLHVKCNVRNSNSPVRLYITMPALKQLDTKDTDDVRLSDFKQSEMHINHNSHEAEVQAMVEVGSFFLQQTHRNKITLKGKGNYINAQIQNDARLDADRFFAKIADITVEAGNAKIAVSDTLRQTVSESGKLRVDGEPFVEKDTSSSIE